MKYEYLILAIGGMVAASGADVLVARVALVKKEIIGDCLNSGGLPSKSFLKGAHFAKTIHGSKTFVSI